VIAARPHTSSSIPATTAETKRRIVAAVEAGQALVGDGAETRLVAAEDAAEAALAAGPALAAIEQVTGGYRYVPELEAELVTLVPHLQPRPALLLAQHRGARVIAYRVAPERDTEERLLALGRALADPRRVEILALVGRRVGRSSDLVDATGLTRSTVHHHLAQLRDAGLVALEGNARAYTYVPRRAVTAEATALLGDLVGMEEQ
jgi:DNA-binding transcriptional ArsR family regulator